MINKVLLTLLFVTSLQVVNAQSRALDEANKAYMRENYCEAAEKCGDAYTKLTRKGKQAKKMKGLLAYRTAESYRQTERFAEANEWYERCILLEYYNVEPEVYYYNAEMLLIMGEVKKARENYAAFQKIAPGDSRAEAGLQSCNEAEEFVANKTRHIIENQTSLNKKEFDMAPMFADRKETKLYYGSNRAGSTGDDKDPRTCQSYMDLWVSVLDKNNNWTEPKLVDGEMINTEDNEGTVCFDGRGKQMFFTRCPNAKKQNLGCDIWVAEAKGKNEWKAPTKITLKTHDSISVGHPCVWEDGKYMIFSSDMPGGFGGKDLWYTTYTKKTDSWETPKNMGAQINTKGNDMFATFADNGDLIFASDGLPGMGGLDIFRAKRVGEEMKWEDPKNIGAPINSVNNDYHLIEYDERTGYFTSERKGPNGESVPDVYKYVLPPNVFDLKVIVSDLQDRTKKIEGVSVIVKDESGAEVCTGSTWDDGSVFWDKKTDGSRYINEEKTYTITIFKDGYHEDKKGTKFTTKGLDYDQNFVIDMALLPKKPIHLPEVRYPLAKWDLLVDTTINSKDSLLYVYDLLTEYPGMVLELSSHTDARGSNNANQVLSENRAKMCYKYLVEEKGIDPRRIVPVGKGELEPTTWKDPETGEEHKLTEAFINSFKSKDKAKFDMLHQLNRRTEGKILSMEFDPTTAPEASKAYLEFKQVPRY